jgi:cyclopropane-fatty-acyl-phospholipid synthase
MADLEPHFDDVQSHYDLSDDFYRLFRDSTQTYICAYFERDDMTLEQAQFAKMDLALGKLGLQPGMTLLDIGCGWGATMMRAVERYDEFFAMAHRVLTDDGVMLLHTITALSMEYARANGIPLTMELARFVKFIMTEIFPGGQLCKAEMVPQLAATAGFATARVQSLRPHYARTLGIWADALDARSDEAVALQSQEVYDRYMHYLTGCARLFALGQADVNQFTFTKAAGGLESAPR